MVTPQVLINKSNRIVVKIGSALIANEDTCAVNQEWLNSVAEDISSLVAQGKEVLVVSSGAIALGRKSVGIKTTDRPSSIPLKLKQAAAALGQVELSGAFAKSFVRHDIKTALALLSPKDTEERRSHLNARATLLTLMRRGIIPIINENDTVSTVEIRFGDNDRLAARVAQMVEADLVVQLSTTDGLYTSDPSKDDTATHIPLVEKIDDSLFQMAGDAPAGLSTGGMKSKLEAARIASKAGVNMMITSGQKQNPLVTIDRATIFLASTKPISARKKWISSHVNTQGSIIIDDGAVQALSNGKSLLPAGTIKIIGDFKHGDPVQIIDKDEHLHATGLVNYSSNEARMILGVKSAEIADILGFTRGNVLVHRQNFVLV
jgi:glutamate 5-kinase